MPIIAVATTKGGPGKTTLARCLADHWVAQGHRVSCLDTDPNRNLTGWITAAGSPVPCQAISEDDVVHAAIEAAKQTDIVIIDVAGSLARALVYAVGVADAVVIPLRPGQMDVAEAVRTQQHIESAILMRRQQVPYAAALVQVNRQARVTTHTREQLAALNVPALSADIPLRVAYQQASYTGDPLSDPAVREDIAAIAAEILSLAGAE